MKALTRFVIIACLLGIPILSGACGARTPAAPSVAQLPTTQATPFPPSAPAAAQSPLVRDTEIPYPLAQDTLPPPSEIPYPSPLPTPTPLPTVTPPPTALSLPAPSFDILWVENSPLPLWTNGVVWRADPRDIANRQEVIRFDHKVIWRAGLSPDGQLLAITLEPHSIWLVNLDGTNLHELSSSGWQFRWSPDSRSIYYDLGGADWVGIERIDLETGAVQRIFTTARDIPSLNMLGLSSGGQWIYFVLISKEGGELWRAKTDGSNSGFVASLGTDLPESSRILLSPQGRKVLVAAQYELRWVSTDGSEEGKVPLPRTGEGYQVLWNPEPNEENQVLVGQWTGNGPPFHLYAVDIPSGRARELVTIDTKFPGWEKLSLSPDGEWLMGHLWSVGYYWIHLPTKTMIPIPCKDCSLEFAAWLPKGTGP